jgi:hypothetical protein
LTAHTNISSLRDLLRSRAQEQSSGGASLAYFSAAVAVLAAKRVQSHRSWKGLPERQLASSHSEVVMVRDQVRYKAEHIPSLPAKCRPILRYRREEFGKP